MRILLHVVLLLGLCLLTLVALDQLMPTHPFLVTAIILVCAGYSLYINERYLVPYEKAGFGPAMQGPAGPTTIPAE